MFIRQTKTRSTSDGGSYFTHRPVESKRVGAKVRQRTVLNLGTNFDLPKDLWPELCIRIEQILNSEQTTARTLRTGHPETLRRKELDKGFW
ncbi:MAG: hypothetical protein ACJA16_004746 [Akkermansiaceae bacterium]|jgi:hypothetical protein